MQPFEWLYLKEQEQDRRLCKTAPPCESHNVEHICAHSSEKVSAPNWVCGKAKSHSLQDLKKKKKSGACCLSFVSECF